MITLTTFECLAGLAATLIIGCAIGGLIEFYTWRKFATRD